MSEEDFETAVSGALDAVPADLWAMADNVAVFVEDEPPAEDPDLLGLYEGVPLTERGMWGEDFALPDRITIFRGPLQRMCSSRGDLIEEITITVVHELAHHFGIDDERLHELGWG